LEIRVDQMNSSNAGPIKPVPLTKTRFTEMLIDENGLGRYEFAHWVFCEAMLFNAPGKWWGDRGRRDFPHEGIDLCLYADRRGKTRRIDEKTRIPVMHDGVVKAFFKDYLGRAVIIAHDLAGGGGRFVSMYAHTNPRADLQIGSVVKQGDVIATLADTSGAKSRIIPHLHVSIGLPSAAFSFDAFVWNRVRQPELMTLLDPLAVIDRPHRVLESGHPACQAL
jgi:murein DD-endopeptidase MepM/ murein hydrolase activator NlpD